ncbi:MAG: hypothetical protein N3F04_00920 [Candidatus Nezhaarchaeota archaeon]|nr:hypothetical protein [Candidatus Nezhaarchaeota archaeon]MCX8141338.1 hypothetical protein [Candidatus Nezhaarchaeota archaeon]MDW8049604.1 cyclophilin-like family protein [Nitrososphaerota archaeon]
MSVIERYPIVIVIEKLGKAEGELVRTYAPLTISNIVRSLPMRSRAYKLPDRVYVLADLSMDVEKPRQQAFRGDIAFWPQASAIAFFIKDVKLTQAVSLIGKVTSGIELIERTPMGSSVLIQLAK